MSFQLIVFDWDGTLMDSEANIVAIMKQAMVDEGVDPRTTQEIRNIIGLGLQEAVEALYPDESDSKRLAVVDRYRYHFLRQDVNATELFDGAITLLQQLSDAGYFLAVATGKGRRGLDRVLDALDMRKFFHITRCADETRSKPHPQMLLEIMAFVGVEPQHTLMVGDSEYDMLLAQNAGVSSVAVSYGVHEIERMLAHRPLFCIDEIGQLWGCLQQHAVHPQVSGIE